MTMKFAVSRLTTTLVLFCLLATVLFSESPSRSITLGFVGDIMVHNSQLRRAWLGLDSRGEDLGYDFSPSFEWFAPYLKAPDLMIGNLETTLGGADSAWIVDEQWTFREYQAYPCFVTPDALAPALADAGFDVIGTANNHCMDSNLEGAARTLGVLASAGLSATGTAPRGFPEAWRGNIDGFDIGILAWTHSVNGLISSRGMDSINVFNATGRDDRLQDMLRDIQLEATRNHDLLILFIHWGQEYMDEPDQYQKNLARLALEAGADVIIGSHPHELQPIEHRIVEGSEGPREAFIAWSMGNFISSQRYIEDERDWVDGSALLELEIIRNSEGRARVAAATMTPFYVHWSDSGIRILSVRDGLSRDATTKYGLSPYDIGRIQSLDEWIPGQMTRYLGAVPARSYKAGWRVDFPEIPGN